MGKLAKLIQQLRIQEQGYNDLLKKTAVRLKSLYNFFIILNVFRKTDINRLWFFWVKSSHKLFLNYFETDTRRLREAIGNQY